MLRKFLFWAGVFCAVPSAVSAAGTPAGTVIQNTATVTYTIGGVHRRRDDTAGDFHRCRADQRHACFAGRGQRRGQLARQQPCAEFVLTNTGNGPETVRLSATTPSRAITTIRSTAAPVRSSSRTVCKRAFRPPARTLTRCMSQAPMILRWWPTQVALFTSLATCRLRSLPVTSAESS